MTLHISSPLRATKTRRAGNLSASTSNRGNKARRRRRGLRPRRESPERRVAPGSDGTLTVDSLTGASCKVTSAVNVASPPLRGVTRLAKTAENIAPLGCAGRLEGTYTLRTSERWPVAIIDCLADHHRKVAPHVLSGVVPIVG
jgi:hypothetical protein